MRSSRACVHWLVLALGGSAKTMSVAVTVVGYQETYEVVVYIGKMQGEADWVHQHCGFDTAFEELVLEHIGCDRCAISAQRSDQVKAIVSETNVRMCSKHEVRPSVQIQDLVYLMSHVRTVWSGSTYARADTHQL